VAALETGRTSWTALLDAVRLGPADDATAVTAAQLRAVIDRLTAAGHWRPGDPNILVVTDAGHDITRLAYVLADLPVELVGRIRSDRPAQAATAARHERAPTPPRTRDRPGQAGDLACPAAHDEHRDHPLWDCDRDQLGPGPPTADPPYLLDRPRRRAAHHRGHPDPAAGRAPARGPRPEAGVVVDLDHRRRDR
jgi:hypothetical protein